MKSKTSNSRQLKQSGYLLMGILSCLLFAVFSLFFHKFYYQSYVDRSLSFLELSLSNIQKDIDTALQMEQKRVGEFYSDETVQNFLALGEATDESFLTIEQKMDTLLSSGYFEQAVLRVMDCDTVLNVGLNLNRWYDDPTAWQWTTQSNKTFGKDIDGRVWLRFDYPTSRPLASLQLYLAEEFIYEELIKSDALSNIYLYHANGTPILDSVVRYPNNENFYVRPTEKNKSVYHLKDGNDYLISSVSANSGWILLHLADDESLTPPILNLLTVALPYILALSCIALAAYIMTAIYNKRLQNTRKEKEAYGQLLQQASPQLEMQLLSDWIVGVSNDPNEIRRALETLDSIFVKNERFLPFLVQWTAHADTPASEQKRKTDVRHFTEKFFQQEMYFPDTGKQEHLVLLRCGQQSFSSLKQKYYSYCHHLSRFGSEQGMEFFTTLGNYCSTPEEMQSTWRAMRVKLEHERFLQRTEQQASESDAENKSLQITDAQIVIWRDGVLRGSHGTIEEIIRYCQYSAEEGVYRFDVLNKLLVQIVDQIRALKAKENEPIFAMQAAFFQQFSAAEWSNSCAKELELLLQESANLYARLKDSDQFRHIQNAKDYVAQNYHDSGLSLSQISGALGISASYLSTLFSQYTSQGFVDYLNQYRVEQACRLLSESDLSVTDIGQKTGFSSSQSFIRVFKKYYAETPGQFRTHEGKEAAK